MIFPLSWLETGIWSTAAHQMALHVVNMQYMYRKHICVGFTSLNTNSVNLTPFLLPLSNNDNNNDFIQSHTVLLVIQKLLINL